MDVKLAESEAADIQLIVADWRSVQRALARYAADMDEHPRRGLQDEEHRVERAMRTITETVGPSMRPGKRSRVRVNYLPTDATELT